MKTKTAHDAHARQCSLAEWCLVRSMRADGEVWSAREKPDCGAAGLGGEKVAIKKIANAFAQATEAKRILRELRILSRDAQRRHQEPDRRRDDRRVGQERQVLTVLAFVTEDEGEEEGGGVKSSSSSSNSIPRPFYFA